MHLLEYFERFEDGAGEGGKSLERCNLRNKTNERRSSQPVKMTEERPYSDGFDKFEYIVK